MHIARSAPDFRRFRKGDFDGAEGDCTEALRLKPDWAVAYKKRGLAGQAKGDLEVAQQDLDKAKLLKSQRAHVS